MRRKRGSLSTYIQILYRTVLYIYRHLCAFWRRYPKVSSTCLLFLTRIGWEDARSLIGMTQGSGASNMYLLYYMFRCRHLPCDSTRLCTAHCSCFALSSVVDPIPYAGRSGTRYNTVHLRAGNRLLLDVSSLLIGTCSNTWRRRYHKSSPDKAALVLSRPRGPAAQGLAGSLSQIHGRHRLSSGFTGACLEWPATPAKQQGA